MTRPISEVELKLSIAPAAARRLAGHRLLRGGARPVTRRLYSVDTEGLSALRTYLEGFWDIALARFEEVAREEAEQRGPGGSRR